MGIYSYGAAAFPAAHKGDKVVDLSQDIDKNESDSLLSTSCVDRALISISAIAVSDASRVAWCALAAAGLIAGRLTPEAAIAAAAGD
jgi:hypothetical protein